MGELGALWVNFEGMGAKDIASHLNITPQTNRDQALVRLIGLIQEQGETLTDRFARIEVLEDALRDLSKQARTVCGFAVSWQPLTPGDIRELKDATGEAERALAGAKP